MKIAVITGSPHKKGKSAALATELTRGAEKSGNEVYRFDAAFQELHACLGCEHCHNTEKGCVYRDAMNDLKPKLDEADTVVFVSPVYYYAVSAQIKTAIDRFYAFDADLHGGKRAFLILTMADDSMQTAAGAIASFEGMTNFLEWENAGILVGLGCGTVEDLNGTDYRQKAYALGEALKR